MRVDELRLVRVGKVELVLDVVSDGAHVDFAPFSHRLYEAELQVAATVGLYLGLGSVLADLEAVLGPPEGLEIGLGEGGWLSG